MRINKTIGGKLYTGFGLIMAIVVVAFLCELAGSAARANDESPV